MRKSLFALPFLALSGMGSTCAPGDFKVVLDDTAVSLEDTGEFAEMEGFNGTIEGTVRVILYSVDENGDYEYRDWSVHNGEWPFGGIWISAFITDESTGVEDYYQSLGIRNPSPEGDDYTIDVRTNDTTSVRVAAQLDYWGDGIMSTWDPIGVYPDEISITDGSVASGIDISILSYWNPSDTDYWGTGGGCPGNCSEGGNQDGTTTVSGDLVITYSYAGGDAAAMLMSTSGQGPYRSDIVTPEPVGGGAVASYSMWGWAAWGEMNLIGCHDSNYNGYIDAGDRCGSYVSEPEVDGNPINLLADENITEATIQVPLGDYGLDLVPFVSLNGALTVAEGSFDDLPSGSKVYVAALKFQPSLEITDQDLIDRAYDYQSWDSSELAGQTSLFYEIPVPANTIVYLMAYADEDGDGQLNENGEHVAAGNSETGRVATGSSSTEISMELTVYEETGF